MRIIISVASVTLAAVFATAPALGAQAGSSIARRVAAAPDGEVRLTYATRSNVCGDGRDGVSIGRSMYFATNVESYGGWSNMRCERGPARVTLTVEGHRVVSVRTRVAGGWASASSGVTDLGTVPRSVTPLDALGHAPATRVRTLTTRCPSTVSVTRAGPRSHRMFDQPPYDSMFVAKYIDRPIATPSRPSPHTLPRVA